MSVRVKTPHYIQKRTPLMTSRYGYNILGVKWRPYLVEKKRSLGVVESYSANFEGREIKKGTTGFITIWFNNTVPIDKTLYLITYLSKYLSDKLGASIFASIDIYKDRAKRVVLSILYPSKRGILKSIVNALEKINREKGELGVSSIKFDVIYGTNLRTIYEK